MRPFPGSSLQVRLRDIFLSIFKWSDAIWVMVTKGCGGDDLIDRGKRVRPLTTGGQ